ncbi:MAG TPA: hypothetical protein VG899_07755 [Mycobacteriales bacterium]|nr:hypothetical protein [Mycobacteriales bacterium]HWA66248.1 hypothetical protein [Mycobacteriales bacterium]
MKAPVTDSLSHRNRIGISQNAREFGIHESIVPEALASSRT